MDERPLTGCRRMVIGSAAVLLVMVLCVVVTTLALDGTCSADMEPRLPRYPNATVTLEQHNFLTQFGMGESVLMLHTDDDVAVVREWYGRTIGAIYADMQKNNVRTFGHTNYTVGQSETGSGTQIILYGRCGS